MTTAPSGSDRHGRRVSQQLPVAICPGDPAGIGPEVIIAALEAHPEWWPRVVVIGARGFLRRLPQGVATMDVGGDDPVILAGQPGGAGQRLALASMEAAAAACVEGRASAVVTGPIHKAHMVKEGFMYPGQTEFFADRWGGEPTMAFCGERMNVVLASWHLPLAAVPASLSPAHLRRAVMHADWLARMTGRVSALTPANPPVAAPRIAVCGLNPHAGEQGLLGSEENEWIDPCLNELRQRYHGLSSTIPADTAFVRHLRGEFDVVVALYHDQGLAPLKTVEFDSAVNVTLGLPWLRTSPDHGTAYSIAGKGRASPRSMERAIRLVLEEFLSPATEDIAPNG